MRTDGPAILHRRIALVIEELHAETRIDGRLVGIVHRSSHLVQAESSEELRLVRKTMVDANGKLIGARRHFG